MVIVQERHCRATECRALLDEDEAGPFCDACLKQVYAFRPNPYDAPSEWFYVLDACDSLSDHLGSTLSGDQCGGCGSPGWELVETPRGYAAKSVDHEFADGKAEGCGDLAPIRLKRSYEVIF